MTLKIKICGLKTRESVDAALDAGADMLGFVNFPPSPRHIEIADAARLIADLPDNVSAVVLTVDSDDRLIDQIVSEAQPAMIQAHGSETPERISAIAARSGLPVMKALALASKADLAAADGFEGAAARLLFDAKPPEGATRPGGHGAPFDWGLARSYEGKLPWMLSGGLNPGNVAEAIAVSGAHAVDVSSGIESRLG
ncbi:MAG: phosphoribosylanthranilate isomerase, partial [Rhizobiales bacterium]|nr:phosphoribosylanthranilate isomerase [Hyphomicrobiales bacterium]